MNKKGQIFASALMLLIVFLTIGFSFYKNTKERELGINEVGQVSQAIIEGFFDREFTKEYVARAVDYGVIKAASDLGCLNLDESCNLRPEEFRLSFETMFANYLEQNDLRAEDFVVSLDGGNLNIIGNVEVPIGKGDGLVLTSEDSINLFLGDKNSELADLGECIVDAEARSGIPAVVMLGIMGQENSWGNSRLATGTCLDGRKAHNLFSIKGRGNAGVCEFRTREVEESGSEVVVVANFRAYTDYCSSVTDFIDLITSEDRYSEALEYTNSPDRMVRQIHRGGYATDPNWADSIIRIMAAIDLEGGYIAGVRIGKYDLGIDISRDLSEVLMVEEQSV